MTTNPRRQFLASSLQGAAIACAGLGMTGAGAQGQAATNSPAKRQLKKRADGQPFHVLMLTYRGATDVDAGFKAYLADAGLDVRYTVHDVQQDISRVMPVLKELHHLEPDLIYTWGTPLTLAVVGPYDATAAAGYVRDIPVVFALVAEPQKAGIVRNLQAPERNVTGAIHVVPLDKQMQLMRSYQPFDKMGMLYNGKEPNSIAIVQRLQQYCDQNQASLLPRSLHQDANGKPTAEGLYDLIASLKQAGAQWLYLPPDTFLGSIYDRVTPLAMAQKLPTFGSTELALRTGSALTGLVSRYYSVGQLAASQAVDILLNKKPVQDIPVESLKRFSLMVNMHMAKQLNLYPPISLLNYAEVVAIAPGGGIAS